MRQPNRTSRVKLAVCTATAVAATTAMLLSPYAGQASQAQAAGAATFTVHSRGFAVMGPRIVPAGYISVHFVPDGGIWNGAAIARVKPGVTLARLRAALQTGKESVQQQVSTTLAGIGGRNETMWVRVTPGSYIVADTVTGNSGKTSVAMRAFTVQAGNQTTATVPHSSLTVTMTASGYQMPAIFPSRTPVVRVVNSGVSTHEMGIFKLAAGKSAKDLVTYLQKSSGPPPGAFYGGAFDVAAKHVVLLQTGFAPGSYAAISFATDPTTHRPDWLLGLVKQFTVR